MVLFFFFFLLLVLTLSTLKLGQQHRNRPIQDNAGHQVRQRWQQTRPVPGLHHLEYLDHTRQDPKPASPSQGGVFGWFAFTVDKPDQRVDGHNGPDRGKNEHGGEGWDGSQVVIFV
ncbi:hypothetical protein F66182_6093 [Fusarium sp. NRRL 66182]|nr:hypothetical protein F66182_6093 [Fusarium sp. NRRL 66182]